MTVRIVVASLILGLLLYEFATGPDLKKILAVDFSSGGPAATLTSSGWMGHSNRSSSSSSSSWLPWETTTTPTAKHYFQLSINNYSTTSLLNDKSLEWDPHVHRLWLDNYDSAERRPPQPPAMLLLTNFGWNQVNQTAGLQLYRGLRSRDLLQGVVNHPWFHPTAWQEIIDGSLPIDPKTRYYVFLDRETCYEKNCPNYNEGLIGNADTVGGRQLDGADTSREHFIHEVMNSTFFRLHRNNTKYLLFDCGGRGPKPHFQADRIWYNDTSQLVFASLSYYHSGQWHQPQDLGLPPPAPHPYVLTAEERAAIQSCDSEGNRTILLSYTGALVRSEARKALAKLDNGRDVLIRKSGGLHNAENLHSLARSSIFSACPRGDNLFSYRLTETMSCGSIPVVYADDYIYPFHALLLDWSNDLAIVVPEARANDTLTILRNISVQERCRRRQRVLEVYETYMKTSAGTIGGLVESLELQATTTTPTSHEDPP